MLSTLAKDRSTLSSLCNFNFKIGTFAYEMMNTCTFDKGLLVMISFAKMLKKKSSRACSSLRPSFLRIVTETVRTKSKSELSVSASKYALPY